MDTKDLFSCLSEDNAKLIIPDDVVMDDIEDERTADGYAKLQQRVIIRRNGDIKCGVISAYNPITEEHTVLLDNGLKETFILRIEQYEVVPTIRAAKKRPRVWYGQDEPQDDFSLPEHRLFNSLVLGYNRARNSSLKRKSTSSPSVEQTTDYSIFGGLLSCPSSLRDTCRAAIMNMLRLPLPRNYKYKHYSNNYVIWGGYHNEIPYRMTCKTIVDVIGQEVMDGGEALPNRFIRSALFDLIAEGGLRVEDEKRNVVRLNLDSGKDIPIKYSICYPASTKEVKAHIAADEDIIKELEVLYMSLIPETGDRCLISINKEFAAALDEGRCGALVRRYPSALFGDVPLQYYVPPRHRWKKFKWCEMLDLNLFSYHMRDRRFIEIHDMRVTRRDIITRRRSKRYSKSNT